MKLRQLAYLVAVAEEANFTRGAARVHVAQPGVSAQIRRLERELGAQLFDRTGHTVTLTEAGAAVLPYARAALSAVDGARNAVAELSGLLRGRTTIGTVASISTDAVDLPALLADFHRDHPAVKITLATGGTDVLIAELRAGRYELALLGLGPTDPDGLEIHVVDQQRLVAAVAPGHALARRQHISLAELAEHSLASLPPGSGLRAALAHAFTTAGLRLEVAFEAADPRALAQLAAHGLGVAVLPRSVTHASAAALHTLTITPPPQGRVAFAWRAGTPASPAARELIRRIRTWPRQHGIVKTRSD